jgi:hypothetical protein
MLYLYYQRALAFFAFAAFKPSQLTSLRMPQELHVFKEDQRWQRRKN